MALVADSLVQDLDQPQVTDQEIKLYGFAFTTKISIKMCFG